VRIVYALLLKRTGVGEQEEISYRLAGALWKINEEHGNEGRVDMKNTSPGKHGESDKSG
jgi:hypothetical protein